MPSSCIPIQIADNFASEYHKIFANRNKEKLWFGTTKCSVQLIQVKEL
jgi:hypothetical protein